MKAGHRLQVHKMHTSLFERHACLSEGLAQFLHKPVVYLASCYVRFKEIVALSEFCGLNRLKTL